MPSQAGLLPVSKCFYTIALPPYRGHSETTAGAALAKQKQKGSWSLPSGSWNMVSWEMAPGCWTETGGREPAVTLVDFKRSRRIATK